MKSNLLIAFVFMFGNMYAQPYYSCYTDDLDLEAYYVDPDLGLSGAAYCLASNTAWEDVDYITASFYYNYFGSTVVKTIDVTGNTLDMNGVYAQLLSVEPNFVGIKQVYVKYYKWCWSQADYSEMDSWSTQLVSPALITVSVPNLCPDGNVNFNSYVTPTGGSFLITGMAFSGSGIVDMNSVAPANYTGSYSVTSNGCDISKTIPAFTVYAEPTVSWSGTLPATILDTDPPINVSAFINATGFTSKFASGEGIINTGGVYYFDPSLAGAEGDKVISIGAYNANGCFASANATQTIEVIHDPGTPGHVFIDLIYAGFDELLIQDPGFVFDYTPPYTLGYYFNYGAILYAMEYGHQVCSGDTINFKVAAYDPSFTYTWYTDKYGPLQQVGTGEFYDEPIPATNVYLEYNIYVSATNNLGVESVKDPFLLGVVPKTTLPSEMVFCINDDTSLFLPLNYDHPFADSFSVAGILDTMRVLGSTTYNWYNESGIFIQKSNTLNYNWNGSDKYNKYIVYRADSSGMFDYLIDAGPTNYQAYYPSWLPNKILYTSGTGTSYDLYRLFACECETSNPMEVFVVKNPEPGISVNIQGEVPVGTPILFEDNSEFSNGIIWDFGDNSPLFLADQVWHYFNDVGIFSVVAIAVDTFGCQTIETYPNIIWTTNWAELETVKNNKFQVYPNPATEYINCDLEDEFLYQVYDSEGRLVLEGKSSKQINIGHLPAGNYLLQILHKENRELITTKFTKQ